MVTNLLIGCSIMVVCLAIQCLAVDVLLKLLLAMEKKGLIKATLIGTSALLTAVMFVMLMGALAQIAAWAGLFLVFGAFTDFATAFYHSVVNFATLGYGDLVMSEERRLLGALEALNGVLMIGLTTGVLFAVLNELLNRAWNQAAPPEGGAS
jgi:hypothetical protein